MTKLLTDGELVRDGDAYVLRFERELGYPIERVWRAITEQDGLAAWFPSTVELELRVGGKVTFINDPNFDVDPELLATSGEVVELDPERRLAFTWGNDLLRFELSPSGDGCRLAFSHRLAHRAMANRTVSGWSVCLDSLAASLDETAPDSPGWRAYYDHYAGVFGEAGLVSEEDGATVVRFERLMPASAERVWSTLAASPQQPHAPGRVGEVLRSSQPLVLETQWRNGEAGGVVKWQLIPMGETSLLLLTHAVDGTWDATAAVAAWDRVLEELTRSFSPSV